MSISTIISLVAIFIALVMTVIFYKIILKNMRKNIIETICLVGDEIQITLNENNQKKNINIYTNNIESFDFKFDNLKINQLPSTTLLNTTMYHNIELFIKFKDENYNNIKAKISSVGTISFMSFCKSLIDKNIIKENIIDVDIQSIFNSFNGLKKRFWIYIIIVIVYFLWLAGVLKF